MANSRSIVSHASGILRRGHHRGENFRGLIGMNNRELVTLIYLGLSVGLLIVLGIVNGSRESLLQGARLAFASRLTIALSFYTAVCVGAVWLMWHIGLWEWSLAGSTILWFLLVGLSWFFSFGDAAKDPKFFRRRLIDAVSIAAVLEVYVNLEVFSIPLEFVLQFFILLVALVGLVGELEKSLVPIARASRVILLVAGLLILVSTTIELVSHRQDLDYFNILEQFLLPLWLTVFAIPVIYLIALFAGYESLFKLLTWWNDRRRPSWRALLGVALELRGSLLDVDEFRGGASQQAARALNVRTARSIVVEFKRARAAEFKARQEARELLDQRAGLVGKDSEGLQLDRREFQATKDALRWLATCQSGWYRNDDDRPDSYRSDFLDVFVGTGIAGLPTDHGIRLKVRADGKAWYAYRQTPSGYFFAIGASGPPPSEWYWDGGKPPPGFPSKRSGWTSFMEPDRAEWRAEKPT
jgi:hypothetical protein